MSASPEKPLVSFILLAYNQEQYIREAVEGAFSQTYSPLEIILSDDCSMDKTFAIIEEMAGSYTGPHKVITNRNPVNLGLGEHYNRLMNIAAGDIVELAAGDDISLPHRTMCSVKILQDDPGITSVSLGLVQFEGDSIPGLTPRQEIGITESFTVDRFLSDVDFHLNAPARAFRRYTHDYFGPLIPRCPVEDGPNLFRNLLHGKAASSSVPAVLYRRHAASISSSVNFRKISFELIYRDYENTLRIAGEKCLLNSKELSRTRHQLARRLAQRLILMKVESSHLKLATTLVHVLPSWHFGIRYKVNLIRRAVGALIRSRLTAEKELASQ